MLLLAVIVLSIIALHKFNSPFRETDMHTVMILREKTEFNAAQKSIQKSIDSTFVKLNKMDPEKSTPIEENDIEIGISNIQNAFKLTNATDPRKNSYPQIASFYRMYYNDKKSIVGIQDNVKLFTKQFEDCMVGYKDRRQQMLDRENALLMKNKK